MEDIGSSCWGGRVGHVCEREAGNERERERELCVGGGGPTLVHLVLAFLCIYYYGTC